MCQLIIYCHGFEWSVVGNVWIIFRCLPSAPCHLASSSVRTVQSQPWVLKGSEAILWLKQKKVDPSKSILSPKVYSWALNWIIEYSQQSFKSQTDSKISLKKHRQSIFNTMFCIFWLILISSTLIIMCVLFWQVLSVSMEAALLLSTLPAQPVCATTGSACSSNTRLQQRRWAQ